MDFPAGKSLRLTKREDIRRVFEEGRRLADSRLTLWGIPTRRAGNARPTDARDPIPACEAAGGKTESVRAKGDGTGGDAGGLARIGVAVSKVHGKAVRRNRVKRVCREAARLIRPDLPTGWDFMIVPRAGVDLHLRGIQDSLRSLARRLAAGAGREARP